MRETKYKLWSKEHKFFIQGDMGPMLASSGQIYSEGLNITDNYIVCLYTSLKDSKGNEIYEGDIIKYCTGHVCEVVFKEGGFCGYDSSAHNSDEAYFTLNIENWSSEETYEINVIGNIYESPELLN